MSAIYRAKLIDPLDDSRHGVEYIRDAKDLEEATRQAEAQAMAHGFLMVEINELKPPAKDGES